MINSTFFFIPALANFIFAAVIFKRREYNNYNKHYTIFLLAVGMWSLGLAMFNLNSAFLSPRFWTNVTYFGGIAIALFLYLFSLVFQKTAKLEIKKVFFSVQFLFIFFYALFFTDYIIQGVDIYKMEHIFGSIYLMYPFAFILLMLLAFKNFFKAKKRTGVTRTQMNYMIYSTLITALLGGIADLILPKFFNIWEFLFLGPYFTLILIGSHTYALIRYDFRWWYLSYLGNKKITGFL